MKKELNNKETSITEPISIPEILPENEVKVIEKQHRKKRIKIFSIIVFFLFVILGFSIAGIVLASLDFVKNIYTSKSICFMVFGCIGITLFFVLPIISVLLGILGNFKEKCKGKIKIVANELLLENSHPTQAEVKIFAKKNKVCYKALQKQIDKLMSNLKVLKLLNECKSKNNTIDVEKLLKLAKTQNIDIEEIRRIFPII